MSAHSSIGVPPAPAVMAILDRFNRDELGNTIEVLVALLDIWDAPLDPDAAEFAPISDGLPGDPGDHEPTGDEEGGAYVEWTTMRGSQKRGPNLLAGHEDAEEDDAPEEDDESGQKDEDGVNTAYDDIRYTPGSSGAGCPISDPDCGIDDTAQDDINDDREHEEHGVAHYGIDQTHMTLPGYDR